MTRQELFNHIEAKGSYLCVGLDSDIEKLPHHLLKEKDPIFEFNKQIIDATIDYAVAYKPNLAFYESQGAKGWESLAKTMEYMPKDVFTIADTTPAIIFAIYAAIVSSSDVWLKPLLLGRGVATPMLVILIGAIGGAILDGVIGLFVGAVVLALGYGLFMEWLSYGETQKDEA